MPTNLSGQLDLSTATEGVDLASNTQVASFTDDNVVATAGGFTVIIDWGDGTTTPGVLTGSNGSFTVTGSHTYAAAGNDTITVFMGDDAPDSAFAFATSHAAIGFGAAV